MEDPLKKSEMPRAGKLFAAAIVSLCLMVMIGLAMMFYFAKKDAENRARYPAIVKP